MNEKQRPKKKIDLVNVAEKKRHLHLVEKINKGKTLNPSELKELKRFETAQLPASVLETQDHVAKTFGVAIRTVAYWVKEGMPVRSDGRYDLSEIYKWKLDRDASSTNRPGSEKSKWEDQFRKYKALIAQLDYQKQLGELVTKEEVQAGQIQRILIVKKALLALPDRLAPQVVNVDVKTAKDIIKKRIESIINDFASGGSQQTVEIKNSGKDKKPRHRTEPAEVNKEV